MYYIAHTVQWSRVQDKMYGFAQQWRKWLGPEVNSKQLCLHGNGTSRRIISDLATFHFLIPSPFALTPPLPNRRRHFIK